MKIVYLAGVTIPDDWAHVLQIMKMSEAFASNGHEVVIVAPKRPHIGKKADPFVYYGVQKTFEIKKLPCIDIFPGSPHPFFFFLRQASFLVVAKVFLFFKKPDIMYTREQFAGLFFKNVVYEIHMLPKQTKWINRYVWNRAKKLVVVTGQIKKRLIERGITAEKIIVAHDAVDRDHFVSDLSKGDARRKLSLPLDKKIIGYVGTLKTMNMEKGVGITLQALQELNESHLFCIVGGEAHDIEFYQDQADALGVSDKTFFIGKVKHELVPIYLKACDVLVAPFPENEHYSYYMSPLKIFEYMASDRPIIVSDLPSIREVLDESLAFFVEPGSSESLARAIILATTITQGAEAKAHKSLEESKKYTWRARASHISEFISS
jgi:glycosyltransferase involved in cell wall biosynthesis